MDLTYSPLSEELANNWTGADPVDSPPATPSLARESLERELRKLYRGHAPILWRSLLRSGLASELAQEAIQEAFLRYFQARKAGAKIGYPKAWLFKVGHNYALDRLKASHVKAEVSLDEAAFRESSQPSPEEAVERLELQKTIQASLTARELDCWHLRVEGFSYNEIADILGVRPGTIGALINRAVVKLKTLFAAYAEGAGSA